jgi:hypothetical protein
MIVLRATQEQYNYLNNYQKNNSELHFALDGNGDWVVGKQNIDNPDFLEIREQLLQLEEIEFVPRIEEE